MCTSTLLNDVHNDIMLHNTPLGPKLLLSQHYPGLVLGTLLLATLPLVKSSLIVEFWVSFNS